MQKTTGFYREGQAGFYSFHPLAKFLSLLLYISSVFQITRWDFLFIFFLAFCFAASKATVILNILKIVGIIFAPILVALLILHGFFHPYHLANIQWKNVPALSTKGMSYAMIIWFRFICAGSFAFLFLRTTKISALTSALEEVKMPRVLSYIILNAINIFPDLQKRIGNIRVSQQARGMKLKGSLRNRIRALLSLLSPLIYGELEQLDQRALTLEIKGFRNNKKPTIYKTEKIVLRDYILIVSSFCGFCFFTGINIWL